MIRQILSILLIWMLLPMACAGGETFSGEGLLEPEMLWDIEDTREENESVLPDRLYMNGAQLGCDRESLTWYCSLGMPEGEDWPEMVWTGEGGSDLHFAFADEYEADGCQGAVADGVRYEAIVWDDTRYSYIGVVFTGLPIIIIDTDDTEIPYHDDVTGSVAVSGYGDPVYSGIRIHERGSGYDHGIDKKSYSLSLYRENGEKTKKNKVPLLGMPEDAKWSLLANATDVTCIRNVTSWDIWRAWNDGEGLTPLQAKMAEVFINERYTGIYQLTQHIDADSELQKIGSSETDIAVRKIQHRHPINRPVFNTGDGMGYLAELRYRPKGMTDEEAFAAYEDFFTLELHEEELDDETFAAMAAERFDMEPLIRYFLFAQVISVGLDNTRNNVWIWALEQPDGAPRKYQLSPWDMDCAFQPVQKFESFEDDQINLWMTMINRILTLNVGNSRETLWRVWREVRSDVVSDGMMYGLLEDHARELTDSGAYARETARWRGGETEMEVLPLQTLAEEHLYTIERYMEELWPEE